MSKNSKGFQDNPNRHGLNSRGIPNQRSFGIVPGFYKSENRSDYKQKRYMKDEKAKTARRNFRKATKTGGFSGSGDRRKFEPGRETYKAKYSPIGFEVTRKDKPGPKWGYLEYMYVGKNKAVPEQDTWAGISTMGELKDSMLAMEADLEEGRITRDTFRWRIYQYHMALISMGDKDHNGEFRNKQKRKEANEFLRLTLIKYDMYDPDDPNQSWAEIGESDFFRKMRPLSKKKDCVRKDEICADDVIWLDKKGKPTKNKSEAVKYRIKDIRVPGTNKSTLTVGDRMHNKQIDGWLKELEEEKKRKETEKKSKEGRTAQKKARKKPGGRRQLKKKNKSHGSPQRSSVGSIERSLESSDSPTLVAMRMVEDAKADGVTKGSTHTKAQFSNIYTATMRSDLSGKQKQEIIDYLTTQIDRRGWDSTSILVG